MTRHFDFLEACRRIDAGATVERAAWARELGSGDHVLAGRPDPHSDPVGMNYPLLRVRTTDRGNQHLMIEDILAGDWQEVASASPRPRTVTDD